MPPIPPRSVPQRDNYGRVSFLYQVLAHLAQNPKFKTLSRAFAKNVDLLSKRTVLKMTPGLKRTLCKKCHNILIPGLTMEIRLENNSRDKKPSCDILVYRCLLCKSGKRFPVGKDPNYLLFSEKEDVVFEVSA